MKNWVRGAVAVTGLLVLFGVSCGNDDSDGTGGTGGRPEQTGSVCTAPSQCYPNIEAGTLSGEVVCMTRVPGGYCTHRCETDEDCCKTPGECKTNLRQVCSPFESSGGKYCFLSCEKDDVSTAQLVSDGGTVTDGTQYCAFAANKSLSCRSSGGGSENRKVCLP